MTAPIDYSAVLADLEARRGGYVAALGQIDAAIAVIRALTGSGAGGDGIPVVSVTVGEGDASGGVLPPPTGASPRFLQWKDLTQATAGSAVKFNVWPYTPKKK